MTTDSTNSRNCDVAVIAGAFSGAATALRLKRKSPGLRVLGHHQLVKQGLRLLFRGIWKWIKMERHAAFLPKGRRRPQTENA